MITARGYHIAALLPNGQVLVAGGEDSSLSSFSSAELYNPATGTWQSTGSMHDSRITSLAEPLGNGSILVAGGSQISNGRGGSLASAETFDPSAGKWTMIASMPYAGNAPGSLLANGDVLVVRNAFYNPGLGSWTVTGSFPDATIIIGPTTATLLATGEVLMTGVRSTYNDTPTLNNTYLYNFTTNAYALAAYMHSTRWDDAATLLPNGQVLVSGGYRSGVGGTVYLASAELYTP
jgi:WD40 repeat protein